MPATPNVLDRAVAWLAPRRGLRRLQARAAMDAVGRLSRLYDGAGSGRRTEGWLTTGSDANAEVLAGGPVLRQRARDLVRNNPWAPNIISRYAAFVAGMKPKARVSGARDKAAVARAAEQLWSDWSRWADADGITNLRGLERLGVRNLVTDGGVLALRVPRRRNDGSLPVPLQVRLLEVDHLDGSRDTIRRPGGGKVMGGIEYDALGRVTTYHLLKEHPGGAQRVGNESVAVPASEVLHVFDPARAEQRMGVSWLAPAVTRFADMRLLDEAEIVKKQVEACLALIIQTPDPEMLLTAKAGEQNPKRDAYNRMIEGFAPGMVAYTAPGEQAAVVNPSATGLNNDYYIMQLHAICAAVGMPYELGTGDLSRVSFISGRMGLIPFYLRVDEIRDTITVPQFMDEIWDWMVEAAQVAGLLPRDAVIVADWMAPERPSLQPLEDEQAREMRIRSGVDPLTYAIAKTGRDPETVLDEYARVNAMLDEREITLDSDPRRTARSGAAQPTSPAGDAPGPAGRPPVGPAPRRGRSAPDFASVNGNGSGTFLEH